MSTKERTVIPAGGVHVTQRGVIDENGVISFEKYIQTALEILFAVSHYKVVDSVIELLPNTSHRFIEQVSYEPNTFQAGENLHIGFAYEETEEELPVNQIIISNGGGGYSTMTIGDKDFPSTAYPNTIGTNVTRSMMNGSTNLSITSSSYELAHLLTERVVTHLVALKLFMSKESSILMITGLQYSSISKSEKDVNRYTSNVNISYLYELFGSINAELIHRINGAVVKLADAYTKEIIHSTKINTTSTN